MAQDYNDDAGQVFDEQQDQYEGALKDQLTQNEVENPLSEIDALAAELDALPDAEAAPQAAQDEVPAEDTDSPSAGPVNEFLDSDAVGMAAEIGKGALRGAPGGLADIADSGFQAINTLADSLGYPGLAVFPTHADESNTLRQSFDQSFGTPDSVSGALAQGITEQLVFILPAFRAVKGAAIVAHAGKKELLKLGAISAGVASATTSEVDGTLSDLAVTAGKGGIFDNVITQSLATSEDDTLWERKLKVAIEDLALGMVGDGTIELIKIGLRKSRELGRGIPAINSAADRAGTARADDLNEAVVELSDAQNKANLHKAAVEQLEEGRKAQAAKAAEEAEVADFQGTAAPVASRTDLPGSSALDEDAAVEGSGDAAAKAKMDADLEAIAQRTKSDYELAKEEVLAAHAKVRGLAETFEGDGRVAEAVRQEAKGLLDADTDAALGAAADRTMPAIPEVKKVKLGRFLEMDEADMELIQIAVANNDVEGLEQSLGALFSRANYRQIETEGLEPLMEALGVVSQSMQGSKRHVETFGLVANKAEARERLAELAAETGNDIEEMIRRNAEALPNLSHEEDIAFNAHRMMEEGLLSIINKQIENLGTDAFTQASMADYLRWMPILGHVSDSARGVASGSGRLLVQNAQAMGTGGFEDIMAAGRIARHESDAKLIADAGGEAAVIQRMQIMQAAARSSKEDAIKVARKQALAMKSTVGDFGYQMFITNLLNHFSTFGINAGSTGLMGAMWAPLERVFEAGSLALINRNLGEFKIVTKHFEGMKEGWQDAIRLNAKVGPYGGRRNFTESFRAKKRVTGRSGGLFDEGGEGVDSVSLLNMHEFGDLFRRGLPVRFPFSRALGKETHVPLLPLSQNKLDQIADIATRNFGPVGTALDYIGKGMEFIPRSNTAFDEIAAAVSYKANLHVNAYEHAVSTGLKGEALETEARLLAQQAGDIDLIKNDWNSAAPEKAARIRLLEELNKKSMASADADTFVSRLPINDAIEKVRDVAPAVRWFSPFVKTLTVLTEQGAVRFNPAAQAGQVLQGVSKGTKEGGREAAKAAGRVALTGGVAALVWDQIQAGNLTGGHSHNSAQRQIAELDKPTYSWKIGDTWVKYNRLDPLAMPIAILTDMAVLQGKADEVTFNSLMEDFINVTSEAMKSRTFLQGMSELFDVIQDPTGANAERLFVSKAAKTVVPFQRILSTIDREGLPFGQDFLPDDLKGNPETDRSVELQQWHEYRASQKKASFGQADPRRERIERSEGIVIHFLSSVHAELPGGMKGMADLAARVLTEKDRLASVPDRDFWGKVVNYPDGYGPNFATPLTQTGVKDDPVNAEMSRLGYGFSTKARFKHLHSLELSIELQDEYHVLFGQPTKDMMPLREKIESIMLDPETGQLSQDWLNKGDPEGLGKGGKLKTIEKVVARYMTRAAQELTKKHPALKSAERQAAKERRAFTKQQAEDVEAVRQNPLLNALEND